MKIIDGMTRPTNAAAPSRRADQPRHLRLLAAQGPAPEPGSEPVEPEGSFEARLAAEEAALLVTRARRAREVFEPRPAEAAALNALGDVPPAQPFAAWAGQVGQLATCPPSQKFALFARGVGGSYQNSDVAFDKDGVPTFKGAYWSPQVDWPASRL